MKQKPKGTAEIEALRAIKDRDQATNEELAHKIGVTAVTVFRWLKGEHTIAPLALKALRRFLARDERAQAK
jgi:DNA-binding transcriptional regulator YiaG